MMGFAIMIGVVLIIIGGGILLKRYLKGKRSMSTGIGATLLAVLGYLDQIPLSEYIEGNEAWLISAGIGMTFTAFVALKSTEH